MPNFKNIPKEFHSLAQEVCRAYADCNCGDGEKAYSEALKARNLHYRASVAVPGTDAARIMEAATPGGYNDFVPELLDKVEGYVFIAREGSVCMYVCDGATVTGDLGADETDKCEKETRY